MIIHLFGAKTLAGQALINKASKCYPDLEIRSYSRSIKYGLYADLTDPDSFEFTSSANSSFLISYAPIWLLAPFLKEILRNQPEKLKNIKGVIVCSSSSVITKNFSSNKFDKDLVLNLKKAEKSILKTCNFLKIPCKILRPTLIYGHIGEFKDKNLSKLISLMRFSLFLPIPSQTGLRQPIHSSQLAEVTLHLVSKGNKLSNDSDHKKYINLGGDEEIKYHDMLLSLQKALPVKDKAKKCHFLPIPNRFFFFLASPLLLFSPKIYAAIERISINLSGFIPSYKLLGLKPKSFPLMPLEK
tara:strand:- start:4509 stop:5405 length:897 start_codon:yes stop_codon:yes gene_type:complete